MSVDPDRVTNALQGPRGLVQADGGDLVLSGIDGTAVSLTLVIEGAECAECVMPRQFLEQVALDMMRAEAPEISAVIITDPRE